MTFGRSMFMFLGSVCILKKIGKCEGEGWEEGIIFISEGDPIAWTNISW